MKQKNSRILKTIVFISSIAIICIGPLFGEVLNSINNSNNNQSPILRTSDSYSGTLYITSGTGYSYVYLGYLSYGYTYSFEIYTSPVSNIDTCVYLFDGWNFYNYEEGYSWSSEATYYCYYNGYYDCYSSIYIDDEYYLVFEDDESYGNYEITYLIITSDNYGYSPYSVFIPVIIGVISIVVVVIIIVGLIVFATRKKTSTIMTKPYINNLYSSSDTSQVIRPVYSPYSSNQQTTTTSQSQKNQIMYCPFCGDKITSDATFCTNCGSKL